MMGMKIGILGGTFDPIHEGHLALARQAQKQFCLDKVFFVPASIPPAKTVSRNLTPAPFRYRMVELAIRGEKKFEVSDVELHRPGVSYTVDTLSILRDQYPDAPLYLILGQDSFNEIMKWKEPGRIRELARFLVSRREGANGAAPFQEGVEWLDMPVTPISSSAVREMIRSGKNLERGILPKGVEQYIRRMNFYRGD
jgi:nicotinate-nucleotide adenylyltransferase